MNTPFLAVAGLAGLLTMLNSACSRADVRRDAVRGQYLVTRVGMCQDCHSPRDAQGEWLADRWLQGATLPFQPTVPMPWAPTAPSIAGLDKFTDRQAIAFLTSGAMPDGRRLNPPMPEFRFSPEDAGHVLAYLRAPRPPQPRPLAEAAR